MTVDLAHEPTDDPDWQESLAFYWLDEAHGIGGGHRLAHEAVRGLANRHAGLSVADGRGYRAVDAALPLGERVADRFVAGTQSVRVDGDALLLDLDDEDAECHLVVTDAHPPLGYGDAPASVARTAPAHVEASGRVRGRARVGGEWFDVDGPCHRDHSWGARRWDWVLDHRWVAGTTASDASFSLFAVHDREGGLVSGGYVRRGGGEPMAAREVDVVVLTEADGLTHRGGTVSAVTREGPVHLECTAADGFVWGHRELTYADGLCRVRWGDEEGFCCFEVANNPHAGTAPPNLAIAQRLAPGLSRRRPWALDRPGLLG